MILDFRCRDGTEYPAEFVIITCSLGVLKRKVDTMFYPPLPVAKAEAIKESEFLLENKAFLVFEDPVWSWSSKHIDITFDKKMKNKGKTDNAGKV